MKLTDDSPHNGHLRSIRLAYERNAQAEINAMLYPTAWPPAWLWASRPETADVTRCQGRYELNYLLPTACELTAGHSGPCGPREMAEMTQRARRTLANSENVRRTRSPGETADEV